ncbi:uncharacterized protein BP5553_02150 [Venustampulla echinocandica]|uniref:Uncharacterized protein n=1 Tax=Venustampulla echinocandica TaxID=2656787 RepID=A0A370U320_9HELO|nr:uncharacterized protein BP5553_02150 [Venustampulla echinocandica]RDL42171.1 hypothetical protein BP5553_02150 [Venustampulla echinocandica]
MGGHAFSNRSPPLATPRMPPEVYNQVLEQTLSKLHQHYSLVESPIEAPCKTTFGDVDILVQGPLRKEFDPSETPRSEVAKRLSELFGAAAWVAEKGNPTMNLAIPWPSNTASGCSKTEVVEDLGIHAPEEESAENRFVQIDVHHLPTPERFRWELFHSAHGDLWNILGTTIRPFGLTCNDRGLYLRIAEIELLDRKKSMVFLTSEPKEVLELLGLEEGKWWKQFKDQEEMFLFATTCRMFWIKEPGEKGAEGDVVGEVAINSAGGQIGGEVGKKQLKHNDRQRMAKRPIFRAWIEDFIPKLKESGEHWEAKVTREQIRDQAFEKFGVKEQYETRLREWRLARQRDEIWRETIKGSVPVDHIDPALRGAAIRTLKAVLLDGELFDGASPLAAQTDSEGFYNLGATREFVESNWRRAGEIGLERQLTRGSGMMELMANKRKRAGEEKTHDEGKADTEKPA